MHPHARKHMMRYFKILQEDTTAGISASPQDDNFVLWNAVIFGPDGTPWDGGRFKLTLEFPEDFPFKPPTVRFVTRMFHPNNGRICMDILEQQWCPALNLYTILISIRSLLNDPNPIEPANSEAARMFIENKRGYNKRVRELAEQTRTAD